MAHPAASGAYSVDTGQLGQHSTDIDQVAREIETLMGAMTQRLHVLQGTWKGQGANQYTQLHSEWKTAQTKVHNTLIDIGLAVRNAGTAYAQVEGDVVRTFTPA